MVLDCHAYRLSFEHVKNLLKNHDPDDKLNIIGTVAVATNVPIIVVACYYAELYGLSDKIFDFIERLKSFYKVTEVLNANN